MAAVALMWGITEKEEEGSNTATPPQTLSPLPV